MAAFLFFAPAVLLLHQAEGWIPLFTRQQLQRQQRQEVRCSFNNNLHLPARQHDLSPRWLQIAAAASAFDDFDFLAEESSNDNINNKDDDANRANDDDDDDDSKLFASLRARQISLQGQRREQRDAWFKPPTQTHAIPLSDDWVRRVAVTVDQYPYAVVGGASGSLYYIDLKRGNLLSSLLHLHAATGLLDDDDEDNEETSYTKAMWALYGDYDGGGIIAIARSKDDSNLVASSGREGGVQISRITSDKLLESLGKIPKLDSTIVTSLAFDQAGILWVGSFDDDAMIRGYEIDKSGQGSLQYKIQADSGVVSLSLIDDIGCGVAATVKHGVVLFSLQNGSVLGKWNPFSGSTVEFARTALLVQNEDEDSHAPPMPVPHPVDPTQEAVLLSPPIWSVVVGGSLGSIHQRELEIDLEGIVYEKHPFSELSSPHKIPDSFKHSGSVVCLASPGPKVLISGARDGTIRVWDCSYTQKCDYEFAMEDGRFDERGNTKPWTVYTLTGYKVWLGSIVALPGNILVSDGADNCIMVQHIGTRANKVSIE